MPWKEVLLMDAREEFVLRANVVGANHAALCREYGISRKTGYKWLRRFALRGFAGLEDLSRRPRQARLELDEAVIIETVAIRVAHPTWGAKKIVEVLKSRVAADKLPSRSSVSRILHRVGLVQPPRRRLKAAAEGGARAPLVQVLAPNDLWTVDFKGWWLAIDKQRCEPLTIRDAFSRFILHIEILPTNTNDAVRAVFHRVFKKFGLPAAILSDNGPPFASSHGVLHLTKLSAWWLALDIDVLRSRPGTPGDNGAHERMHRDMAAELQPFAALNPTAQQRACDRWRHEFNTLRPHEALGMQCPASVYHPSSRCYLPNAAAEPSYPDHFQIRRVSMIGSVSWKGNVGFISHALEGQLVGLEPTGTPAAFRIWFGPRSLGKLDFTNGRATLVPDPWFGSEVSPHQPR